MIKLLALIYFTLNGVVDPEPARIVNSLFTFDTIEACEEFKKSETGLRAEAMLHVRVLQQLEGSPVGLHEIMIHCIDSTPKRDV